MILSRTNKVERIASPVALGCPNKKQAGIRGMRECDSFKYLGIIRVGVKLLFKVDIHFQPLPSTQSPNKRYIVKINYALTNSMAFFLCAQLQLYECGLVQY